MISELNFAPTLVLGDGWRKASSGAAPLSLKIFNSVTDKSEIYALRYRAFIEAGLITARKDGLFCDSYDDLKSSFTLAAFNEAGCVGSFRLTFGGGEDDVDTMPCQSVFAEVGRLEQQGFASLVEFTRMAIAPELTNTSFRTTLYAALIRAGLIVAHAARTDYGLISINPAHVHFYAAMCGFRAIARAENYPGINAPAVLLGRDFRALDEKRNKQNPFFKITPAEILNARATLFPEAAHALPDVAVA